MNEQAPAGPLAPIQANQANQLTIRELQSLMMVMYQNGIPLHFVLQQSIAQAMLDPAFNPADLAPLMTGALDGVDPAAFVGAVRILAGADRMLQTPDPTTELVPIVIMGEVIRRTR